jgi:hypothetical protein
MHCAERHSGACKMKTAPGDSPTQSLKVSWWRAGDGYANIISGLRSCFVARITSQNIVEGAM